MQDEMKNWYGPIAMQKRRLAQLDALIEHYTRLVQDFGDAEFGVALERARQQKARIQAWLAIHDKRRSPGDHFANLQNDLAGFIF